jgi:hypothetical protein
LVWVPNRACTLTGARLTAEGRTDGLIAWREAPARSACMFAAVTGSLQVLRMYKMECVLKLEAFDVLQKDVAIRNM